MAFSPRELEHEYSEARYVEYRRLALRVGIVAAVLILGLWLRDVREHPGSALSTLPFRLLMAAGVLLYVAALALRARRRLTLLAGYAAVLVIEFVVLAIWDRLGAGYSAGIPDYLYMYLLAPLLMLQFSLREIVLVLVTVGLVPNLQVALGIAPVFPLHQFNVVMWPACAIVAYWLYEFDLVFRHLFLSRRQAHEQAFKDPLTQLGNRRYFDERGNGVLALARRRGRPFSVLMIDIDHFKRVNDEHGHAAGDEVLRALGATLAASLRGGDVCGRLGGEEFAVVLPDENGAGGAAAAERLRRGLERLGASPAAARGPIDITVSIGVAAYPEDGDTLEALLARADGRLFRAKQGGRNRVVAAD
jgi:diguanylate cyclase (GGDEF)-like protein